MIGSSFRALARVAWRDIARHRARSVMVVLLVLLPVAAMVAGIAILRTSQPSQERQDVEHMGRADLIAQGVSERELRSWLPAGSTIEPTFWSDGQILVEAARPGVTVRGIDLDGLGQTMLTLVDGHAPKGAGEAAISAEVGRIADVSIGGDLILDDGQPVTVVGLIENGLNLTERIVVLDPRAAQRGDPEFGTWLVGLPPGADPEAIVAATYDQTSGVQRINLMSRLSGRLVAVGGDSSSMILVLGSLALVEAALVASAAFAVSIRRRQRELGMLAATGATPRQLAGSVLAGAAILGVVACLGGVLVGLVVAFGLSPFLDDLTQRRNPSIIVDGAGIVGPALIGLVAAVVAAIVPARTVARVPVLLALSGRRPSEVPARRALWLGLMAVGVSIVLTLLGAGGIGGASGGRELLVLLGAVLGTLGFGACAPWLLERLDGLAVRLPLASRIAFRDTARSRSRSSPIVTAVLASAAATIMLGTTFASGDAEHADDYRPYLYPDQLVVRGAGADSVGRNLAAAPAAIDGTALLYLRAPEPGYWSIFIPEGRDADGELVRWGDERQYIPQVDTAAIATPEMLALWRIEDAASHLAAGRIVVLWDEPMTAPEVEAVVDDGRGSADSERRFRYPVTVISTGGILSGVLPGALVPASIAAELGLEQVVAQEFVVRLDHAVTQADVDAAAGVAARALDTFVDASLGPARPDVSFRVLLIGLALLFAVSVTGVAIALGEAESRPEQRSLLALGADPHLRRRIVAARAAVLALLAGILSVPAGLLPAWALYASLDLPFAVPALEIAGAILALPAVAVLGAWLLSRPIPDWNAFRNVGIGQ